VESWHRFYDPDTGRYVSADPIGLAGGMDLYAYVQNGPINWSDPKGMRLTPEPGVGYNGPEMPRPNNLPGDKGPQRGPGASKDPEPAIIYTTLHKYCDLYCYDWDYDNNYCREKPVPGDVEMIQTPESRSCRVCLEWHYENVIMKGNRIIARPDYEDPSIPHYYKWGYFPPSYKEKNQLIY